VRGLHARRYRARPEQAGARWLFSLLGVVSVAASMGLLGGCCKAFGAFAVVPAAIIVAVLFETPAVTKLDEAALLQQAAAAEQDGGAGGSTEPASAAAPGGAEFGAAVTGGMGSGGMFDRIAFVYDSTNKWMSLGLDQVWRKALINECMQLRLGDQVLDLATGTADVSILAGGTLRAAGAAAGGGAGGAPVVLGLDPSAEMLRRGVAKVEGQGLDGLVRLVKGDAQDLSTVRGIDAAGTLSDAAAGVVDASIDKISMSFGIRNVPDRSLALKEMRRVLRPKESSQVCILEFSLPDGEKVLSKVAKFFIAKVVPLIGKVATMNSGSDEYLYLERSIMKFPKPRDFAAEMARAGLPVHTITSFAYGAVHLYAASPVLPS